MSKRPIFPITEPQHFSDYGFDLQIGYSQVSAEAKRHAKRGRRTKPWLDAVHLKLQKPISKDKHHVRRIAPSSAAGKWLRLAGSALLFWNRRRSSRHWEKPSYPSCYRSSYSAWGSGPGPLYMTETHSRAEPLTCPAKSGPLAGPYFNLRELNPESGSAAGAGAMPVYLVT